MKVKSNGTGADCLLNADHGASVVLSGGEEWCPHQSHDVAKPIEPGLLRKQRTFLDAQAKAANDESPVAATA